MMRRISLLLIALVAFAFPLFASGNRDMILSKDGTLYTVESGAPATYGIEDVSDEVLRLTIGGGDQTQKVIVPASLGGGSHSEPALAWDDNSQTLFVFWRRMPNRFSSQLLFATYRGGKWSEAKVIDDKLYFSQWNLAISVTTRAIEKTAEGDQLTPALALHAIWWEESENLGEVARYAQISVRDGQVQGIISRDLVGYISSSVENGRIELAEGFDRELLRHPAVFASPLHDSVEVFFSDWNSNRIHRVQVRPIVQQGVLTEPIGVHVGQVGPPRQQFQVTGNVSTQRSADGSSFAISFHNREEAKLSYFILRDAECGTMKQLSLNEQFSVETAATVIQRLVEEQ